MKTRIVKLLCVMSACSLLIACGQEASPEVDETTEVEEVPETEAPETVTAPEEQNLPPMEEAYKNLLTELYDNGRLPFADDESGYLEVAEEDMEEMREDSSFAVYDVDGDEQDELVVYLDLGTVAGYRGIIYGYDSNTDSIYEEFWEFPDMSFYENGAIEARISHNQGPAIDFWPYSLYKYDIESDSYVYVGFVEAYEKGLYEDNKEAFDELHGPYPYDADKDGNGVVYYITEEQIDYIDDQESVDDDEYLAWLEQTTGGSKKCDIEFYKLNGELKGR